MGSEEDQLALWDTFVKQPGDEFEFRIARSPDAIIRDTADKTFSQDAIDALMQHVLMYVGTRLTRHYEANSTMPQSMTVRIKVALDTGMEDWSEDDAMIISARDERTR